MTPTVAERRLVVAQRSPAERPRMLVLSHVQPFPRSAGQQLRVYYTLKAARERFHVTFASFVAGAGDANARRELGPLCDEVLLLPDAYAGSPPNRAWQIGAGTAYMAATGLKRSNYVIGRVHFPPRRVAALLEGRTFDCALFEYWHAVDNVDQFRSAGVPCILDMHDILWRSYERRLSEAGVPGSVKGWALTRYRRREEQAWSRFDAVVAINREEERYVRDRLSPATPVFHAAMGTDLTAWSSSWAPVSPPRVAYYGAFSSSHNQASAERCAREIMPIVWSAHPGTELWLVGSNPPARIRALASDSRVIVTGFLEAPQKVLRTMTAVLCPWVGTYGFRSRLVEVMALGVPTVVTADAVWGMDLEAGRGMLVGDSNRALADHVSALLRDRAFASRHSVEARKQVEASFSLASTYGRLMRDIRAWLDARQGTRPHGVIPR
jgi:glycosyltransferase involved in cell wall biosynthesis